MNDGTDDEKEAAGTSSPLQGERFEGDLKMVVSPADGVFEPVDALEPSSPVKRGQLLGHIRGPGVAVAVVALTAGVVAGVFVLRRERVRRFQRIASIAQDAITGSAD